MDEWMEMFLKNLIKNLDETIRGKIEVNYNPATREIKVKIKGPYHLNWEHILCETEMEKIQCGYVTSASVADAIIYEYKRALKYHIFNLALK